MCAPRSQQKADASDSSGDYDDDEEQQSPVKSSLHGSTPDNGAKAPRDEDAKATVVAKKEANVAAFCDAIAEVCKERRELEVSLRHVSILKFFKAKILFEFCVRR